MGEIQRRDTASLSRKELRDRKSAKDVLDRAEREIRRLTALGVDVVALSDRFESAKLRIGQDKWSEAEMTCSEILILAKSMQAITSASMQAGAAGGSKKISEAMKMEVSRLIAKEVTDRIEAVARTLPTASSLEETVQTKIQEALVTGGLVQRLENIAVQKAQSAVAKIPRFTAKDAQAAANLVVQRSLTQFLSSKDLVKKIKAAVETELTKGLDKAEKSMSKALEAHVNTKIASVVDPLPTKKNVDEQVAVALGRFVKEEPFENRVLELAAERAKAELERAPDLMSEAASKIAREAADSLFKTHVRSKEFAGQIKEVAQSVATEISEAMPSLSTEDVEVIASRVGEESLTSLAESDVLHEKMDALGKELVAEALGAEGFDAKVKALAKEVATEVADATPHVTPEELQTTLEEKLGSTVKELDERTKALEREVGEGLQEAASRVEERIKGLEEKLGEGLVETTKSLEERTTTLEQKLSEGLAETTKSLEERTSALEGKLSEGLDEKVASALARLDEISSGVPTKQELEKKILDARRELMTNEDFGEWLKDGTLAVMKEIGLGEGVADLEKAFVTPESAQKISRDEALGAAMDMLETSEFSRRIVELMSDEEFREEIPDLGGGGGGGEELDVQVKKVFAEQLDSDEFAEKVKGVSGGGDIKKDLVARVEKMEKEALPTLVEKMLSEKLGGVTPDALEANIGAKIQEVLASQLDPEALNKQILEIARGSIAQIANTTEFKAMLDGKFKMMMNYIVQDVLPKQIRRLMGS